MIQSYEKPTVVVTLFAPLEHLAQNDDERVRTVTTTADDGDYDAGTGLESSIW